MFKASSESEELYWAVDTQNEDSVKIFLEEHCQGLSCREVEKCFQLALQHENETIISLILNSSMSLSGGFLAKEFEQCAKELTNPRILLLLQQYLRPLDRAEKIRCSKIIKGYYVVDPLEIESLDNIRREFKTPQKQCSLAYLRKKNRINDAFIDAVLGDRRLIVVTLLEFPCGSGPSLQSVEYAFARSVRLQNRAMCTLLAPYITSVAYDEAFEATAEDEDLATLQWLLSGNIGFAPSQQVIDSVYMASFHFQSRQSKIPVHLGNRGAEPKALSNVNLTTSVAHVLRSRLSPLLAERVALEERRARDIAGRQAFARQNGGMMTDIHAFSGRQVAYHEGEDDRDLGNAQRTKTSVNKAVIKHIERRVAGRIIPDQAVTMERLAHLIDTCIPPEQRNDALSLIGNVFNRRTATLFATTLAFLDTVCVVGADEDNDAAAALWIMGFLSESVLVHSCNPGAVERVVTGLRGLDDPGLDAIFAQAEGPALAAMFLKGTLNIYSDERVRADAVNDDAITLGERNSRNLARELHRRGITAQSSSEHVRATVIAYARDEIASYGVDISQFANDIDAIADSVADSFDNLLRGLFEDIANQMLCSERST